VKLTRTGIDGLDTILGGGLPRGRIHLIEGPPGVGKTTFGLQFALAGVRAGEQSLYVTFGETGDELEDVAASHGWSLDGLDIYDHPSEIEALLAEPQTVFHPAEVELSDAVHALITAAERVRPQRAVIDGLSELRLLSGAALGFRHQIMLMRRLFAKLDCTLVLLHDRDELTQQAGLRTLAHGVVQLSQETPAFGPQCRRLQVLKMRGRAFHSGYHDCRIVTGGLEVFPRLVAADHRRDVESGIASSGVPALDALLGGGLSRGTNCILVGPAGVGKSTVAVQFAAAAADRGEPAAVYLFEESLNVLLTRVDGLGLSVRKHLDAGRIRIRPVNVGEFTPGEFIAMVRNDVQGGVRLVVIDSLTGYMTAMAEERILVLSELLSYLGQQGVVSLLVVGQHGLGFPVASPQVDLSYLADTVLMFRYYEFAGEVRKALSAFKKRTGSHETTLRDFRLEGSGRGSSGIVIGEPLTRFRGILTGTPLQAGELPEGG
jgi:circadian clock protein KaiC